MASVCMPTTKYSRLVLLFLILGIFMPKIGIRASDTVTLVWDSNVDTITTGYKIHYGSVSGKYVYHIDCGNVTTYSVNGLLPLTYYFAATAYDLEHNESGYSNEAVRIPNLAILSTSAAVNWYGVVLLATTNNNAAAILRYKQLIDNAPTITIVATVVDNMKTQHRAIINVASGTNSYYSYTWIVTDSNGNSVNVKGSFQTH